MAARLQLIQEPQPLLHEGDRQVLFAGNTLDRQESVLFLFPASTNQAVAELLDCRRIKKAGQRQLELERFADTGDNLNGQQGISADIEEIIANAELFQPQDLLPDRGQLFLNRCAWTRELRVRTASVLLGLGQSFPIDLAVGC